MKYTSQLQILCSDKTAGVVGLATVPGDQGRLVIGRDFGAEQFLLSMVVVLGIRGHRDG